jgi:Protein of unknown function (DUF4058)
MSGAAAMRRRAAMPVHDWARVDAGIFHDFHHSWLSEIARALNDELLPSNCYALIERQATEVRWRLTGLPSEREVRHRTGDGDSRPGQVFTDPPALSPLNEPEAMAYRRKKNSVVVRTAEDDELVALVDVLCPVDKGCRHALHSLVAKAAELLDRQAHLLLIDLHPPGRHDPGGIHRAVWEHLTGLEVAAPDQPLTIASYQGGPVMSGYVTSVAVGDVLPDMPLFLCGMNHVRVPLEATYRAGYGEVPRRWRRVVEGQAT